MFDKGRRGMLYIKVFLSLLEVALILWCRQSLCHLSTCNIYQYRCQFSYSGIGPVLGLGQAAFLFSFEIERVGADHMTAGNYVGFFLCQPVIRLAHHKLLTVLTFSFFYSCCSASSCRVILLWSKDKLDHRFRPTLWNMKSNRRPLNCRFGRRAQKLRELNSINCTLALRPGISTKIPNSIKTRL